MMPDPYVMNSGISAGIVIVLIWIALGVGVYKFWKGLKK